MAKKSWHLAHIWQFYFLRSDREHSGLLEKGIVLGEREASVGRNKPSPTKATAMIRDIKYIGIDVHKEAGVIAVLNGLEKLVIETLLEIKASSVLQFIHSLRGGLQGTRKNVPGRCTICCSRHCRKFWSAIRAGMPG